MAERLFTNTTGAYGYEPEVDDTLPHTFGEFSVPATVTVTAGQVVVCGEAVGSVEPAAGQSGVITVGIAKDTVTGVAGTPKVVKVVTAGFTTATAGGTVSPGSPVVADSDGLVVNLTGFAIGDEYVGRAVTGGSEGDTVVIKVAPAMFQLND